MQKNVIEGKNFIYEVRGKQVMLDYDLAKLYQCTNGTKSLYLAVKRNSERFPSDFYFQLTEGEYENLKLQNETLNWNPYVGVRKLPYVFTMPGVAMLATVLKTEIAGEISIRIMDYFIAIRKYIGSNLIEQKHINPVVREYDGDIKRIQEVFKKFEEKKWTYEVFFDGKIYDGASKIMDIFKSAKESLVIIDCYADKTILDLIKKLKVEVTLIVKKKSVLHELDKEKYQKEYPNLKVLYDNTFHDCYFILDYKTFYHCGASLNSKEKKNFSINLLEDEMVKESLLDKIKK